MGRGLALRPVSQAEEGHLEECHDSGEHDLEIHEYEEHGDVQDLQEQEQHAATIKENLPRNKSIARRCNLPVQLALPRLAPTACRLWMIADR